MKKIIILSMLLYSSSSFAVTEQVVAGKKYLANLHNTMSQPQIDNNKSVIIVDNFEPGTSPAHVDVSQPETLVDKTSIDQNKGIGITTDIKSGQKREVLTLLQKQMGLNATGLLDANTVAAIKMLQREKGLNETGIIDPITWFAIFDQPKGWQKTTIEESISQWENVIAKQAVNNSNRFMIVNIPTMTLHAYRWENGVAVEEFNTNVVIGRPSTKTPLNDFSVVSIKYHPTWTPTSNMLKRNVYKNGGLNTKWLRSHGLYAYDSEGNMVDYADMVKGERYRFSQPSGNSNALGVLKFETNSSEHIYLHDTNEKHYFKYNTRAYSSGCIRVEDYKGLAIWITNLKEHKLEEKLDNLDTRIEGIGKKIPVYFTYSQVLFNDESATFAPDIYKMKNNITY